MFPNKYEPAEYIETYWWGWYRKPTHERKAKMMVDVKDVKVDRPDSDVYHTLTVTLGVKPIRKKDGTITKVSCTDAWATRPNFMPKDMELVQLEIEVPASMFGYIARVKGKIESKLVEEYHATIAMLED